MKSLRELYRIGSGPSSSHTMGPRSAALIFRSRFPQAENYRVILYGSLAATGKGHLTDQAVRNALTPAEIEIIWKPGVRKNRHPNALEISAFLQKKRIATSVFYSIGGGAIEEEGVRSRKSDRVYTLSSMRRILAWCRRSGRCLDHYVFACEPAISGYLKEVWVAMQKSLEQGLQTGGVLPGSLALARKAHSYLAKARNARAIVQDANLVFSFALAVAEENAAGGIIVTAPTCGSAGVLPAVLAYIKKRHNISDAMILRALAIAGLIGNLVKYNASISGAEAGCQAEIGTACAMAAAAAAFLFGGANSQIEYAAEMGMEHHLGLTCDPVAGLVQIPCIERNAMAAMRALEAAIYALASDGTHKISFDEVTTTMAETGRDLAIGYRETALAGLARHYRQRYT